ncbi:MAG: UDP-N-acetylmuramate dehydrogenase [bacterium]
MTERHAVNQEKIKQVLSARLGPAVEFDRELAEFTSFRTGGPAGYFYTAAGVDDVIRAVRVASELNLPRFILGGGTNLLVSDKGYGGLVIRVDIRGLDLVDDLQIDCGAGEPLSALVEYVAAKSLSGLEFAAGIWGTAGGAVCGNAGAYGGDIGSTIVRVTLIDPQGELKEVTADYCRFDYRDSRLKSSGDVIIEARLKLKKGDPVKIRSRMEEIMTQRRNRHPVEGRSAGCFFKNIIDPDNPDEKIPAGRLLDETGAKEISVGDARVFAEHANIIVNAGAATSGDIRALADLLAEKVYRKFGVRLQPEVVHLGEF